MELNLGADLNEIVCEPTNMKRSNTRTIITCAGLLSCILSCNVHGIYCSPHFSDGLYLLNIIILEKVISLYMHLQISISIFFDLGKRFTHMQNEYLTSILKAVQNVIYFEMYH